MKILMTDTSDRLNHCLAKLLGLGCCVSCALIASGLMLPALGGSALSSASHLVSVGIVLLITLPVMRVAAMGIWFLFHRDLDFALIAALVLTIIIASTLLGTGAG